MANDDVTPELYDNISADLERAIENNKKIQRIQSRVERGKATHYDLDQYSKELGKLTSKSLSKVLTEENLPNGTLYKHIATGTVGKTMKDNLTRVNNLGSDVQSSLNQKAGIGLKPVKAKLNAERVDGLVDKISGETYLEDARGWLNEPVINLTQSYAASFMKSNADFQYKSGLSPLVTREASIDCCSWCADLDGVYEYGSQPEDIWRRHDYCRCTVTFDPRKGDGQVQDSWSKEWMSPEEAAKREDRKQYHAERTWAKNDAGKYKRT